MQRIHGLAALLCLAACSSERAPAPAPEPSAKTTSAPVPPAPPIGPAEARNIDEKSDLLEFGYGWPAAAEARPLLRARFEQEMAKDRSDATQVAEADRKERQEGDFPFNPHSLTKSWSVSGESPLLLALSAEIYEFTGGAHGNTGYQTLVWEKQQDKEIARAILFPLRMIEGLTTRYCDALDRARAEKRGAPVPKGSKEMFDECPPLGDQALTPLDSNANGRFDAVGVLIGPYEAGPYAEGSYELELPIDATILAAIPEAYRDQFEVKR